MDSSKTENDKIEFWKMVNANDSFLCTKRLCQFMLDEEIVLKNPFYRDLITAVYVMYGRPFTISYGVGKINESIVPEFYKDLHSEIMNHRNWMYAHTDARALRIEGIGYINQVILKRTSEYIKWAPMKMIPNDDKLDKIIKLCDILIKKVNFRMKKFEDKYREKIFSLPPGEYRLVLEPGTDRILEPM